MFGKRSSVSNTTIIGRGARFSGSLELEGSVLVEGHCEGTIRTGGQLSVGPDGSVVGELSGNTVSVAGRVQGIIVASETLHVLTTGSLDGEVFYGKLQVDSGGVIDGHSHQGTRPPVRASMVPSAGGESVADDASGIIVAARPTSVFPGTAEFRRTGAPGPR